MEPVTYQVIGEFEENYITYQRVIFSTDTRHEAIKCIQTCYKSNDWDKLFIREN